MRILNFALAAIFLLFAYFQLNDTDPALWVSWYLFLAILAAAAGLRKYFLPAILLGLAVCIGGLAYLMPDFVTWINDGMPTITGSMKAESKYIELVREFLGLVVGLIFLLYLFFQGRRWKRKE